MTIQSILQRLFQRYKLLEDISDLLRKSVFHKEISIRNNIYKFLI